jgi:hypothetical protein
VIVANLSQVVGWSGRHSVNCVLILLEAAYG